MHAAPSAAPAAPIDGDFDVDSLAASDDDKDGGERGAHAHARGSDDGSHDGGGNGHGFDHAADTSDIEDGPDEANAATTDYKRGSRFKKIVRLFGNDTVGRTCPSAGDVPGAYMPATACTCAGNNWIVLARWVSAVYLHAQRQACSLTCHSAKPCCTCSCLLQLQATKSRFRLHSIFLVVGLLVAHIGAFVLMYILLTAQRANVESLNVAGETGRRCWCRNMAILGHVLSSRCAAQAYTCMRP